MKRKHTARNSGKQSSSGSMRVRFKSLDKVDEQKLVLAYWLLAKRLVEDETDGPSTEDDEAMRIAQGLDEDRS